MIIVELIGGLGNQLFQYAAARSLAEKHHTQVKINPVRYLYQELPKKVPSESMYVNDLKQTSLKWKLVKLKRNLYTLNRAEIYKEDPKRIYSLKHLKVSARIMNSVDFVSLGLKKILRNRINVIHAESEMRYLKAFENFEDNSYLIGYWQSEKYFKNIEEIIKSEFQVKTPQSSENKTLLEQINNTSSISLHVRRGDYVAQDKVSQRFGTCDLAYYQRCIEYIKANVENPNFFIFSDDPNWAKENIITGCLTIVSFNPPELDYEDLRLMYSCKHFIIANSSFSWWGAWLSQNKEKIVLAPKRWFIDPKMDDLDIVPESWIKM